MIEFKRFELPNGLQVLYHKDISTPLVVINILYKVGAKHENPERTGFAHLFEHLMFGGSINIPVYDRPLENVGGQNNAFTNNDYTNYYLTLPKSNFETGLWLESDRMLELAFSQRSLDNQKSVVIEEFKQNYLNQPYGDVWHLLRDMVFKVHPYRWPTIGLKPEHIQDASMQEVRNFYYSFYRPNNAIMVIAGNLDENYLEDAVNRWFSDIPSGNPLDIMLPTEPLQTEARFLKVERPVPVNAIYKAFRSVPRLDSRFYCYDLISEVLSGGKSSRLYRGLVEEQRLFSSIDAYIMGDVDGGMFVIEGKLNKDIEFNRADEAIGEVLTDVSVNLISESELEKLKNKIESAYVFSELGLLNKAMNLAYFQMLGDAEMINAEKNKYLSVMPADILRESARLFKPEGTSTIFYQSKS